MTYTVGATVFGIGISSQTMYNGTHVQKTEHVLPELSGNQ
jgi:hypothetical protein